MQVSVVIATYNRCEKLRNCLTAVCQQTDSPLEIIVVDDASTDNTQDLVQAEFPQVKYVRQANNQGPAAARNRGIRLAIGDVVAFTDDDCVPPPDWLQQIADAFRTNPTVVGVGGYQDPPPEQIARNNVARADHISRLRRWGRRAQRQQQGGAEIPGLATNNVAYRREPLVSIGGFDERFPVAAGEDADLKLRMAQCGSLLYLPLGVQHYREYSLKVQWRLSVRRGFGAYHFEAKHTCTPTQLRIGLRLLKRTAVFAKNLLHTRPDVAAIMYLTAVADVMGQWQARKQAKRT